MFIEHSACQKDRLVLSEKRAFSAKKTPRHTFWDNYQNFSLLLVEYLAFVGPPTKPALQFPTQLSIFYWLLTVDYCKK